MNDSKKSAAEVLTPLVATAVVGVVAYFLVKRVRTTKVCGSGRLDDIVRTCARAAEKLDSRIHAADSMAAAS
jgi:hypothetical protein